VTRAAPARPASDTRISRTATACGANSGQTPSVSKTRRLPLPSAVVRSSKLGWSRASGTCASTTSTLRDVPANASARLAPTMPPPTMAMSTCVGVTDLMRPP
jgi:hypothetical protein